MTYPSLWLALAFAALLLVAVGFLTVPAQIKDPLLGQRKALENGLTGLLGFVFTPAWFFALTGRFPWDYAAAAIILYFVTGIALWFALRAAGLPKKKRLIETTCLNHAFMKPAFAVGGCALLLVVILVSLGLSIVAFRTAGRVDLATDDGLFTVAIWVFVIPTAFQFILSNMTNVISLSSAETPQQTRVSNFAITLRTYVLSAWSIIYPFISFHSDLIEQNPRFVAAALIAYIISYVLFVVMPYGAGRTRFIERSKEQLETLNDAASRIIIATDPEVSLSYRKHSLSRVEQDLRSLIKHVVAQRPFFNRYLTRISGNTQALLLGAPVASRPALPAETATESSAAAVNANKVWDKIIDDHGEQLPSWDYRFYIIAQVKEMLEAPHEAGWLRGAALETQIAVARWLNRHYSRSVVLGSLGVAASAIFALGLQAYLDEIRGAAEAAASSITTQLGPPLTGSR